MPDGSALCCAVVEVERNVAVPARHGVLTKDHVQGRWYKDSMAISLFVEATAYVGRLFFRCAAWDETAIS